jgi:hypothetical protein
MSPFEFVSIFFSIVLGLALAHVLVSFSNMVEARGRVRTDWIHSLWVISITVLIVHSWWGMWGMQNSVKLWNYASFWTMVIYYGSVYLLSTFLFPRVPEEGTIDLGIHFEGVRKVFMGVMAVTFVMAGMINHVLFHQKLTTVFVVIPIICAGIAIVGGVMKNRIYQGVLATIFLSGLFVIMVSDQTVLR